MEALQCICDFGFGHKVIRPSSLGKHMRSGRKPMPLMTAISSRLWRKLRSLHWNCDTVQPYIYDRSPGRNHEVGSLEKVWGSDLSSGMGNGTGRTGYVELDMTTVKSTHLHPIATDIDRQYESQRGLSCTAFARPLEEVFSLLNR
jgi:hypothetical protein